MREQGEQEKEMDSNPMNGAANVDYAKADIITRRNVSIRASTVTCVAATEAQNAVEEEEEETGTTAMVRMKDTETKTRNSEGQRAKTKPTRRQLTDREPQENHFESKQTGTMEEKAHPTRVPMIPITGAIASHQTMKGGIQTREEATE